MEKAVERYARATADFVRMHERGLKGLPHQRDALRVAAVELEAQRRDGVRDLDRTFVVRPELIDEAAKGRTANAIRAMMAEADIRTALGQRADRFVESWQQHVRRLQSMERSGHDSSELREDMGAMGKQLQRDPQLESLLRGRVKELGLKPQAGASLSRQIDEWLDSWRSRGLGR